MPRSSSIVKVELEAAEEPAPLAAPDSDTPFRIAVLGDFTGRASRGLFDPSLRGRRAVPVDRDNFEEAMARMGVELHSIRFAELDDFHPDRLFDSLRVFQDLRETRAKLNDRSTFAAAAAEIGSWRPAKPAPEPEPPSDLAGLSADALFARMLDEAAPASAEAERAVDEFDLLLREIVAPHVEPKPDPRQPELVAQVDEAISQQMRAILHHPEFQAIESAWRGVYYLVRRLETGVTLKLHLIDISKAELAACLEGGLAESPLYELLVEQSVGTPGADPWAVLAGNYTFEANAQDTSLLRRMGRIARHAGAPFLAAASPGMLGCGSAAALAEPRGWRPDAGFEEAWSAVRRSPEAGWTGLALPRFLMRLPYGRETDSTERFDFEEMRGGRVHEDYLWGNPVFACAALLGEGFSTEGWEFRPDACRDVEGLPVHVRKENGESTVQPVAEVLLTERAADAIGEKGFMALLSMKDSDRARLLRFQSVAEPLAGLGGRWG